jgi:hypothetical protein
MIPGAGSRGEPRKRLVCSSKLTGEAVDDGDRAPTRPTRTTGRVITAVFGATRPVPVRRGELHNSIRTDGFVRRVTAVSTGLLEIYYFETISSLVTSNVG